MISITTRLHPGPLADEILRLGPALRTGALDLALARGVPLLLSGGAARGGGNPAGKTVCLRLTGPRIGQVNSAAAALGVPPATVVREAVRLAELGGQRFAQELEYRRRGLPGDPEQLGDRVLQIYLDHGEATPPAVLDALRELDSRVAQVDNVLRDIQERLAERPAVPTTQDLLSMSEQELRKVLRRLGGRAPAGAAKGALLALIRQQEQKRK